MKKGMSFEQWCLKHDKKFLLDLWDCELNHVLPSQILARSQDKYYFMCPNGVHESSLLQPCNVIRMKTTKYICKKCGSVAQTLIDMYGDNALALYWDYEANNIDPWDIFIKSDKKIYIKCQQDPEHGSYDMLPRHFFTTGCRCPYCFHRRVLPKDSFAQYVIDKYGQEVLDEHWDYEKNSMSPWEISPNGKWRGYMRWVRYPNRDSRLTSPNTFFKELDAGWRKKMYTKEEKIAMLQDVVDGNISIDDVWREAFYGENLTGREFERLKVISFDYQKYLDDLMAGKNPCYYWICKCSCDGENAIKSISGAHLTRGRIVSCGCWLKEKCTGENHPNWKGGVNSESYKARHTVEGELWRKNVMKRDSFMCQCCGSTKNLNAHHLYNFVDHLDIRYDVTNGITLCERCHSTKIKGSFHHMYKATNNTPDQLREYILQKSAIDIYQTHPEILQLIQTQQND